MPNHVQTHLTITGKGSKKVFSFIRGDDTDDPPKEDTHIQYIDFDKILPMPKSLEIVSGGTEMEAQKIIEKLPTSVRNNPKKGIAWLKQNAEMLFGMDPEFLPYIKNHIEYGHTSWYNWSIDNWGTKWNAYSQSKKGNTITFQTAWSVAEPVIAALSERFKHNTFSVTYADEDIGNNCGRIVYENGECIETYHPEEGQAAAAFACEVWGYDYAKYRAELEQE